MEYEWDNKEMTKRQAKLMDKAWNHELELACKDTAYEDPEQMAYLFTIVAKSYALGKTTVDEILKKFRNEMTDPQMAKICELLDVYKARHQKSG